MRTALALALGCTCVAVTTACGYGNQAVPASRFPAEVRDAYIDVAPAPQVSAIRDGVLTPEEYGAAVGQTQQCLQRAGVFVTRPSPGGSLAPRRPLVWQQADTPEARTAFSRCYDEHLRIVERLYLLDAAELDARHEVAVAAAVSCLQRHAGVSLPQRVTVPALVTAAMRARDRGDRSAMECVAGL